MTAWLRRNNSSVVEIGFCVFIGVGLLASVVTPDRVARVVELSEAAQGARWIVIVAVCTGLAALIVRLATNWGPIRVGRNELRWRLSGPVDRTRTLSRRMVGPLLAGPAFGAFVGGAVALLMPDLAVPAVGSSAVVGVVAVVVAYLAQIVRDRSRGTVRPALSLSPGRLHQLTFAPRDGYPGAVGLALSMMDFSWMENARVTRWMRWSSATSVRLRGAAIPALIRLDVARVRRHPEACLRAVVYVAVGIAVSFVVTVHWGAAIIPVFCAYSAGSALAGGLRSVSENAALRRSFGVSDRSLAVGNGVVPVVVTIVVAVPLALAWQIGALGVVTSMAGAAFAVVRRATRPALPYGSEVVIDSVFSGAAFQPAMITAQLRGPVAAFVTAIVVGALAP